MAKALNLKKVAKKIQAECIRKHGNTEEAAKHFWKELITAVYKRSPEAVPAMIEAQPDPNNKEYMQSIYDELRNDR
jgi:hypothetical protein